MGVGDEEDLIRVCLRLQHSCRRNPGLRIFALSAIHLSTVRSGYGAAMQQNPMMGKDFW